MTRESLSSHTKTNWWLIGGLLVAALLAMPWDVSLAQFFLSDPFPGELRSLVHKTEFFGHGYGILGISFTIFLLCEQRKRQLVRLLATAAGAGVACDLLKLLVHRTRPVDYSFEVGGDTFLGLSFTNAESIADIFSSSNHSFPSAHTATAVAFAMVLAAMFPKAKTWFLTLAAAVAISRFDGGAHFVSDTLVGASIGYVVACGTLGDTRLARLFNRFESGALSWRELLSFAPKSFVKAPSGRPAAIRS